MLYTMDYIEPHIWAKWILFWHWLQEKWEDDNYGLLWEIIFGTFNKPDNSCISTILSS